MAKAEHTIDIRIEGLELLEALAQAREDAERRAARWRFAAGVGWALALFLALAAPLLLGCSAPDSGYTEPEACPNVPAAEVPLPEGCTDDPCGYDTPLERCTRTYVCASRPGVCVTAYDCACAAELAACLDDGTEAPSICVTPP